MVMNRKCTLVWLLLIGLTIGAYLLAESWGGGGSIRGLIILAIAGIKFFAVAWWFMELRAVSKIWASGLGVLLAVILVVVAILA